MQAITQILTRCKTSFLICSLTLFTFASLLYFTFLAQHKKISSKGSFAKAGIAAAMLQATLLCLTAHTPSSYLPVRYSIRPPHLLSTPNVSSMLLPQSRQNKSPIGVCPIPRQRLSCSFQLLHLSLNSLVVQILLQKPELLLLHTEYEIFCSLLKPMLK